MSHCHCEDREFESRRFRVNCRGSIVLRKRNLRVAQSVADTTSAWEITERVDNLQQVRGPIGKGTGLWNLGNGFESRPPDSM